MSAPASTVSAALLALFSACTTPDTSDDHTGPPGHTVRDSAGITIVENDHTRPAWTDDTRWRIADEPALQIGTSEGDPNHQLFRVRDARRFSDGTIAVANHGSAEVKLFDPLGRHLVTVGGRGDGPAEFRSAWRVWELPADSLMMLDTYRNLYKVFGTDGTFHRVFAGRVDPPMADSIRPGALETIGRLSDGTLVVRAYEPEDPSWSGVMRNHVRLLRFGIEGQYLGTLGRVIDQTVDFNSSDAYFYGASAKQATADSTLWHGLGDRFELQEIALDGVVRTMIRLDRPLRPVTEADLALAKERFRDANRRPDVDISAFIEARLENAGHPEFFPAHFEIHVDPEGHLWVQDYQPFGLTIERVWTIFDPEGRYLGDLTLPGNFQVHHIDDRYIVGVWTDDLDVEYVQLLEIVKP